MGGGGEGDICYTFNNKDLKFLKNELACVKCSEPGLAQTCAVIEVGGVNRG